MSLFELRLHLFTRRWGCERPERVRTPLYVLWILQQAHLVAMCQCHWPPRSPSGGFTHPASRDSCSIRGASRTADAQTKHGAFAHLWYERWRANIAERTGKCRNPPKRVLRVKKKSKVGSTKEGYKIDHTMWWDTTDLESEMHITWPPPPEKACEVGGTQTGMPNIVCHLTVTC